MRSLRVSSKDVTVDPVAQLWWKCQKVALGRYCTWSALGLRWLVTVGRSTYLAQTSWPMFSFIRCTATVCVVGEGLVQIC
jgi:hypothetical protein